MNLKVAARRAVESADDFQKNFGSYLQEVEQNVDKILKPHIELVQSTEKLTKAVKDIKIIERLDKQEKETKFLKILLLATLGISILSVVVPILVK